MKNLKLALGLLLVSGAWFFSSCQKTGMNPASGDLTAVTDESKIADESAKIDDIVNIVAYDNFSGVRGLIDQLPSCATITYDTASTPKVVTVDFGTTPCQSDWDGKFREGVLQISWTGQMKDPGSVKTVTTQNYFVGTVADQLSKFDYVKTVTNLGLNDNGNLHFGIVVSTATITLFDGGTISWTANHDREWVQGTTTPDPVDDVFMITGSSEGTDHLGQPFTTEITTPLMKDGCAWIVSGVKEVTHGTDAPHVVDYGNGTCDDLATVTFNGQTRTIHLNQ